jgi:hypothetical protein
VRARSRVAERGARGARSRAQQPVDPRVALRELRERAEPLVAPRSACPRARAADRGGATRRFPTLATRLWLQTSPRIECSSAWPDRRRNSAVLPERKPARRAPSCSSSPALRYRKQNSGRPFPPANGVEADQLQLVRPLTCSPSSLAVALPLHAPMPVRPQGTGGDSDRGPRCQAYSPGRPKPAVLSISAPGIHWREPSPA